MTTNHIGVYPHTPCDTLPPVGAWASLPPKLARIVRLWNHRRAVRALSTYNDRMLQDIGLNRSDVSAALEGPFWSDPSESLARTVKARRRTRSWPTAWFSR